MANVKGLHRRWACGARVGAQEKHFKRDNLSLDPRKIHPCENQYSGILVSGNYKHKGASDRTEQGMYMVPKGQS